MEFPVLTVFYVYVGFQVVPLAYGLWHFKELNKSLKLITILIALSLVFNILADVVARLGYYNTPIINLYQLVELIVLYAFFHRSISIKGIQTAITILTPLMIIFWVVAMLRNWYVYEILSDYFGVVTLSYILLVFAYFYEVVQNFRIIKLEHDPKFWIASGLLISMSGKVLSFISYVFIDFSVESLKVWALTWIMEIIFLCFLLVAYRTHLKYGNSTNGHH